MKKFIIAIIVVVLFTAFLTACNKDVFNNKAEKEKNTREEDEGEELKQIFFGEFIADDTTNLNDTLTKQYSINELKDFFDGHSHNEGSWNNGEISYLTLDEVNQQYPLEIIRTKNYSVYKVEEGGYFYVFWVRVFANTEEHIELNPRVYFTVYLKDPVDKSLFRKLKVNKNTFGDVKEIDPSVELCLFLSRGTYSYSYLNNEEVLEIEYTIKDSKENSTKNYDDLVVKKIKVIPRMESASGFGSILSKDLP